METLFLVFAFFGATQSFSGSASQAYLQSPTATPESYQTIEHLNVLINNPSCTLPCWWDLTLEVSTLSDLQDLAVAKFGENFAAKIDDNYIHAGYVFLESIPDASSGRLDLGTGFWFRQSDEKLVAIGLELGYPSESYVDYSSYLPENILSTYGQPDEVTLIFVSRPSYDIMLKYHDLGLYIY